MSCCAAKLSLQYNFVYSTNKNSLRLTNTQNANHDTSSGINWRCKVKFQKKKSQSITVSEFKSEVHPIRATAIYTENFLTASTFSSGRTLWDVSYVSILVIPAQINIVVWGRKPHKYAPTCYISLIFSSISWLE